MTPEQVDLIRKSFDAMWSMNRWRATDAVRGVHPIRTYAAPSDCAVNNLIAFTSVCHGKLVDQPHFHFEFVE